jgi:hypothetical protein
LEPLVLLKERGQLADGWRRRQRGAQEIALVEKGQIVAVRNDH